MRSNSSAIFHFKFTAMKAPLKDFSYIDRKRRLKSYSIIFLTLVCDNIFWKPDHSLITKENIHIKGFNIFFQNQNFMFYGSVPKSGGGDGKKAHWEQVRAWPHWEHFLVFPKQTVFSYVFFIGNPKRVKIIKRQRFLLLLRLWISHEKKTLENTLCNW